MAAKKYRFVDADLKWAEKKLLEWMAYIDKEQNQFDRLEDRMAMKMTAKGTISMIAATKESQMESLRKTMKDIFELLPRINELRKEEESMKEYKQGKGGIDIPDIMK